MNAVLFFLGAVLLYGAYGALVLLGKTAPDGYVAVLVAGLTFLGKHVSTSRGPAAGGDGGPAQSSADPSAAAAVAAPTAIAPAAAAKSVGGDAPTLQ
ncbi:hypothetical protein [Paraburkholderia caballeronis]|uniref:Uncharacterized protein n=1 Tax=Paraburkholderia caballeronis TaxID=416943 RepID=A0A1H7U1M1_9BURK|nr:hypothetical protein [Paraburkholderia caballeronis]PXW23425.1 hypothetical protein C7403_110163 [Paraburkholderia caballeronis]PXW98418.1 hypothetical protein C7407_110163 [Paraburkholderia caballeronis]RAJ95149.1 hypothetical protein C7409_110164 [Paraburkholderia caballeronis]SEC54176.1 hypothetical protein SAMN05445871_2397 [Paraburkholderia caballeronis]SEL90157.1 hypothetical protein SAMN05192542_11753 [Paraburkholderia caballeronis]